MQLQQSHNRGSYHAGVLVPVKCLVALLRFDERIREEVTAKAELREHRSRVSASRDSSTAAAAPAADPPPSSSGISPEAGRSGDTLFLINFSSKSSL